MKFLPSKLPLYLKIGSLNWNKIGELEVLTGVQTPHVGNMEITLSCIKCAVLEWGVSHQGGYQTGTTPLIPVICHMYCHFQSISLLVILWKLFNWNLESLMEVCLGSDTHWTLVRVGVMCLKIMKSEWKENWLLPLKERSCTLKLEAVLPYGSTENELLHTFTLHFIASPVRIRTFKYLKYFNIKLNLHTHHWYCVSW